MDTYDDNRIKEATQTSRDISGRRIFVSNEGQTMPQNTNDWNNLRNNGENKTKLINFFLKYFSTQKVRSRFKIKLLLTESTNTWEITPSGIIYFLLAIITKLIHVLFYTHEDPSSQLQILTQEYLLILKQSVTSLETVFVKFYQDSIVLLVVIKPPTHLVLEKLALLRKCVVSAKCICYKMWEKTLIRYYLYSGKENETFVSTTKRLYKNQKYKNSSRLIPDTDSSDEHLKRADLQTLIWRQCMENIIEYPDPIDRGWQASTEGLCPLW